MSISKKILEGYMDTMSGMGRGIINVGHSAGAGIGSMEISGFIKIQETRLKSLQKKLKTTDNPKLIKTKIKNCKDALVRLKKQKKVAQRNMRSKLIKK